MIEKNTTIPTKKSQVYSTAEDNQQAVTVRVAQGERSMFNDNKLLGSFNLEGIPPAGRGIPQIEVTFDIDANGLVKVSAKDLGSGKETDITITASTNLSDEEIKKMQEDAEKFAEEDAKKKDEIETVNNAEQLVYQTRKTLDENKDKVDSAKVEPLMAKIDELDEMLKAEERNIEGIKAKVEEINTDAQALFSEMYAQQGQAEGGDQTSEEDTTKDGEKVVDTEAEEKSEDKKD